MSLRTSSTSADRNALLFLALACFWGTSFVAIETGLEYFPPVLFAGVRYVLAGLVILAYAVATTDRWIPRTRAEWLSAGVAGLFVIAAYHALAYLGQMHVSAPVAAVVVSLSPVLTAVFAAAMLDESLDAVAGVGFLLGVLGVVIVANPDPANFLSSNLLGIVLVLLGAASFALGSVLTAPLRTTLPTESMQAWAMLIGAAVLLAVSAARGESVAAVELTLPALVSLGYLTLVSGVVSYLIYFALLDRVGATEINLVGYLQPVAAAVTGWALFGQVVDATTLAGFLVIFVGFGLVTRETLRARLFGRSAPAAVPDGSATTTRADGYDAD
ncbi:DMT family transporter [Halogeometricum luteum]|uniref:DMT family transporter n=1 Tax=Halogeometricum luteum TaxID=2950537 RepID=A0ABU2FWJ0_9EURY|nr:DMT family transporter [Halogeometricum sp. S3BR5-2]MDS0292581.1 DMT family transporter [Halogeometricum sp. S3BR5-2]